MVLPPVEKSPVVLLRWTDKAKDQQHELIDTMRRQLESNQVVMLPTASRDTALLTATQSSLEEQAERDQLIKKRRIVGPHSVEIIMDFFKTSLRHEFCRPKKSGTNTDVLDADGLFSVHERCHLVLGLLERISVQDPNLLATLSDDTQTIGDSSNLRYLLQSHGWIDVLTPLHVDEEKEKVLHKTWYPLTNMMPPIEEMYAYYGPHIAYYFAFMGFLGTWLGRLGVVGLSTFLFRLYRQETIDEDEVCVLMLRDAFS